MERATTTKTLCSQKWPNIIYCGVMNRKGDVKQWMVKIMCDAEMMAEKRNTATKIDACNTSD